jgi:hypothetical protein
VRLIYRYEADGKRLISVRSWDEYQHPNRPKASKYPEPPSPAGPPHDADREPSRNGHAPSSDATLTAHGRDTPGEGGEKEKEKEMERAASAVPALSLVPDPAPPSAAEVATQRFEDHLWPTYPKRNGKRLGKAKALAQWKRLSVDDQRAAVKGARNYAAACATGLTMAKDPERWLRDRCWDDWQDPATPDRPVDSPAAGAFPEASARW